MLKIVKENGVEHHFLCEKVNSSVLTEIGYAVTGGIGCVLVRFKAEHYALYQPVTEKEWRSFRRVVSIGAYFNLMIKRRVGQLVDSDSIVIEDDDKAVA